LSGCPSGGTCTARINLSDAKLRGWMKVVTGGTAETGGWDGWISLSCQNSAVCGTSLYGPVLNPATDQFSGFAWGSTVLGWIDFSRVTTTFTPPTPGTYSCFDANTLRYVAPDYTITDTPCAYAAYGYGCIESGGGASCRIPPSPGPTGGDSANNLKVSPRLVTGGGTTVVSWNTQNAASCSVTGGNGDSWSGVAGSHTSSAIVQTTTYTLHCDSVVPGFGYDATATVSIAPGWREI
jgi:hypothetical protein